MRLSACVRQSGPALSSACISGSNRVLAAQRGARLSKAQPGLQAGAETDSEVTVMQNFAKEAGRLLERLQRDARWLETTRRKQRADQLVRIFVH